MQRFFITLIIIFVCGFSASAQGTRISMAFHPQFVWCASDTDKVKNEGLMLGLNAGLMLDFFFAEKYAISTGLFIDNLGGRRSYQEEIGLNVSGTSYILPAGVELKQRIQYIGIPFGLKLKTQEIGYSTYYIHPGLMPMVALRSRGEGGLIPKKSDLSDETRLINAKYFISGGVEYSLGGSTSVFGGLGYSAGFLNITSDSDSKISTRALFLTMGILF